MEEAFLALLDQPNRAFGERPDGFPAVACYTVSGAEEHTLGGPDGLLRARVQVDCFGRDYSEAKLASRAVIAAVNGHISDEFPGIWHDATRDGRENAKTGAIYRVSLDFRVIYRMEAQQP